MSVELQRRLFTVDEYHAMARAGVLTEDDRVELIEGEVVRMAPIGSRHAACVDRLTRLFSERVADRAIVRVQSPVRLSELTEPDPDVALLKIRDDFYEDAHPGPRDVRLVVEVADGSLHYDRERKIPLYGRARILEAWLVDLESETVEVYRSPTEDGYEEVSTAERGDALIPVELTGVTIEVEGIFG